MIGSSPYAFTLMKHHALPLRERPRASGRLRNLTPEVVPAPAWHWTGSKMVRRASGRCPKAARERHPLATGQPLLAQPLDSVPARHAPGCYASLPDVANVPLATLLPVSG